MRDKADVPTERLLTSALQNVLDLERHDSDFSRDDRLKILESLKGSLSELVGRARAAAPRCECGVRVDLCSPAGHKSRMLKK